MHTSLDAYRAALVLCIVAIVTALTAGAREAARSRTDPVHLSNLPKYATFLGIASVFLVALTAFVWAPSPLLVVAFTAAGASCGFLLHFPFDLLATAFKTRSRGEMAGHFIGLVGVLYAIVLGFVVVTAWEQFYRTEEISTNEQHDAYDLFNTVAFYDYAHRERGRVQPQVDLILSTLTSYAGGLQEEWQLMNRGGSLRLRGSQFRPLDPRSCRIQGKPSAETPAMSNDDTMAEIRCRILQLDPDNLRDQAVYESSLRLLTDLSDVRNNRRQHYEKPPLQPEMWTAFVLGGLILVGMLYLVEASSPGQRVRAMAVGSMIGMMWALAAIFNHPFDGSSPISFGAWKYIDNAFGCEAAYMSGKAPNPSCAPER